MEKLSSTNRQRQLAIILDGADASAPTIISTFSQHFEITGEFSESEITFLVRSFRSGRDLDSLEPEPTSEIHVPADQD